MKKSLTIFLQVVIVLIGIGVLTFMLWEPHLEGVNAHATVFEIYFKDPFLAYVYISSTAFFTALYQAFKTLGYARQNKIFSHGAVKALRTIKYCLLITVASILGAEVYILIASRDSKDDAAGAFMLGIVSIFLFLVMATAAAVFEKVLQNAVDIKSENDLTV